MHLPSPKNVSVAVKLLALTCVVGTAFVASSVMQARVLARYRVGGPVYAAAHEQTSAVESLTRLLADLNAMEALLRSIGDAPSSDRLRQIRVKYQDLVEAIAARFTAVWGLRSIDDHAQELLTTAQAVWADYVREAPSCLKADGGQFDAGQLEELLEGSQARRHHRLILEIESVRVALRLRERQLERETDTEVRRVARGVIALDIVLGSIVLVSLVVVARSIVSPLRELKRAAERIADGDLAVEFDDAGGDEIGDLSRSLLAMLRRLRATLAEYRRSEEALREIQQHLERRVEERTAQVSDSNRQLEESLVKVRQIQRKLLEISRKTGMADVATAVLHNVGNVLNSANVSAGLAIDTIRSSRIAGLTNVNQLLREHRTDLAGFFTGDERGRQLIDYLDKLAEVTQAEQATLIQELGGLQKNLDHIKNVVSMQQSHARSGGMLEDLVVDELVEDALRFAMIAAERSAVEVIRDFAAPISVSTDRHKVSQILLNLLSNARHAVRDQRASAKRIIVRTRVGQDRLSIEVADTGHGIEPENLTRVFNHGFTTKKDGHGFGLHSSACAAAEMGGMLTCSSAGPGQGATFILQLPLRKRDAA